MEVTAMEDKLQDHELRITSLEKTYGEVTRKLMTVENGQLHLENTVLSEFKESKDLTRELITHQFKLQKQKLTAREKTHLAIIAAVSTGLGAGGVVAIVKLFL